MASRNFLNMLDALLDELEVKITEAEEREARRPAAAPVRPEELRVPCSPDDDVVDSGYHKHMCDCGNTWKHSNAIGGGSCTRDEFHEAHTCDACGAKVTMKYGEW